MAAAGFTEQDVRDVRADVASDRAVTVWFTAAAVGFPPGGSARVVTVGDVADGDFIQVRPAGSRDTMFCSPGEITRTRPARRRAPREPAKTTPPTSPPARPAASAPPARPAAAPPEPAAGTPVPTRASPRRRTEPGEISVHLAATAEGEWTVEVLVGRKRVVAPAPVPAAAVATAARALPPAVGEAIESSLAGARQRQRDRVEQLRAELDAAQRMLDQLGT